MLDGELRHDDTHGGGGMITDGGTQWMTAGAGIQHQELPSERLLCGGGVMHGVQLWVNLRKIAKWSNPRYQDIGPDDITLLSSHDGSSLIRVVASELAGHTGPGVTYTPITYLHATVAPEARLDLRWPEDFN